MKLVKFSCGCIGTEDETIVKSCSGDGKYGLYHRPYYIRPRKQAEPLTSEETQEIIEALARLIVDGYQFRELKRILS